MVTASTITFWFELIGIVLTLTAAVIMVKIAHITGWFKAWYVLSASFFLIVIRRAISLYVPYSSIPQALGFVNSTLLLILSIMFVVGFGQLYKLFKEKA
jgi:hypothetical protein